ncbi:hypothetical protein GCM10023219_21040 [Stakelama sediminis]|uniref:Glycosyltransferase involved in cell wall biosynthesis n=1 Tax=Stakelama sediminis TaxID=463200 RepID=A0A840Z230_9SPHN|nr:glycosyltransferase family A protein [Stakelama sediminis]MBB5719975.1 glycosyltransferase involved in cell wall biosynthesis [Stakelama sediminis]
MSGISAIIPTYNRADLLPVAIRSIQDQSLPVGEIIIVDDGSGDGTVEVVEQMARDDRRIRLLQRRHGGANRARNAGAAEARGQWLAFLDSDDAWEPDRLAAQWDVLRTRPEAVAAFCGFRMIGSGAERIFLPPDNPSLLALRCANVLSSTSSALIRADILERAGGFDAELPSCQDWDLWFRLRQLGPFAVVRKPLVIINEGDHDRITTNNAKVIEGHRRVFERLKHGVDAPMQRRRITAAHMLVLASAFKRHREWKQALGLACRSLMEFPSRWGLNLALTSAAGLMRTGRRAKKA